MATLKTYAVEGLAAIIFVGLSALSFALAPAGQTSTAIGQNPERIISLAPHVTETLFALGLGGRVVGVTSFCDQPPAARDLPKVGGFKGKSLEAIIALRPDLVIGTRDGNEEQLFQALDRLRVRTLAVQPSTVESAIASIREIGRAAGADEAGERLAASLEAGLLRVREKTAGGHRPRVVFVYGRDPLVLAGPGTFADDLIRLAGGENIAGDARVPYPRFSLEAVVARAPEVIIEGAMGSEVDGGSRLFWSRLPSLPAVKSGRIELIDEDLIARPGPRIILGLEAVGRAIHPELFAEELEARP